MGLYIDSKTIFFSPPSSRKLNFLPSSLRCPKFTSQGPFLAFFAPFAFILPLNLPFLLCPSSFVFSIFPSLFPHFCIPSFHIFPQMTLADIPPGEDIHPCLYTFWRNVQFLSFFVRFSHFSVSFCLLSAHISPFFFAQSPPPTFRHIPPFPYGNTSSIFRLRFAFFLSHIPPLHLVCLHHQGRT
jgi:hypothetical protein